VTVLSGLVMLFQHLRKVTKALIELWPAAIRQRTTVVAKEYLVRIKNP
jgi:hypothetical protein